LGLLPKGGTTITIKKKEPGRGEAIWVVAVYGTKGPRKEVFLKQSDQIFEKSIGEGNASIF